MISELIEEYALYRLGRFLSYAAMFAIAAVVALTLSFGTDALEALGLSRSTAGLIVTLVVVAGCVYGLYWFATRLIDW